MVGIRLFVSSTLWPNVESKIVAESSSRLVMFPCSRSASSSVSVVWVSASWPYTARSFIGVVKVYADSKITGEPLTEVNPESRR